MRYTESFKHEQEEMLKVATELSYDESFINDLKNAKSIHEMDRIMINARKEKWGNE